MATKKLRLTPEEKELFEGTLKALEDIPHTNHLGDAKFVFEKMTGQWYIDHYDEVIAMGINVIPKEAIKPKIIYNLPKLSMINTRSRMEKALREGRLHEEVKRHQFEMERFIKRQNELNTTAKDDTNPTL